MAPTMGNGKICYVEVPADGCRAFGGVLQQGVWLEDA